MRDPVRYRAFLGLAAVLSLSACNNAPEQPSAPVEDNVTIEVPVEDGAGTNVSDPAPAENAALNMSNTAAAPPAFTDTEQMREDADATGLTARLPTDDSANQSLPAQ